MMRRLVRRITFVGVGLAVTVMLQVSAMAQSSAELYKSKCAVCHAAEGTGDTPMGTKLGVKDFKASKSSDSAMFDITKKGKAKMPAYNGKLTDDQIKDLVKYIRGLGK